MKSKKHTRSKTKAPRKTRQKARQRETTAIVLAKPAPAPIQAQSVLPTITQTVENMERVRRFVSKCLNVDLQRELKNLKARKLKPEDHGKQELALRARFEIDWGTIPGVDKPFLMQPGAEKFLFWLNLRPKFTKREIDKPDGHLEIIASVTVYSKKTGEEVFEGPDCSCSTMESNYRFRFTERKIKPADEDIQKLKAAGLGRLKKKWIYAHGKPTGTYEWVWLDRIENPNIHDERNKVRQIGEKRALVKCVRNMGAISEIFTSDPSEWEQETVEEGSPEDDQDFTPAGRRILTQDGHSPSGRYKTYEAEHREAKQASQKVAEQKLADMKKSAPKGIVELFWASDAQEVAQVRVPDAEIVPVVKEHCGAVWLENAKVYVIPLDKIETLKEICKQGNYTFKETQAPGSPSPAGQPIPSTKQPETTTKPRDVGDAPPPLTSVVGLIKKVAEDTTSERKIPILRVNIAGAILGCFDKKLWEFLRAGVGKDAELITKGARKDICGIKRINHRLFDPDGYTPIIQNTEDRPTHIEALFA